MGRKEMIARARSAFREVLQAMETPHAQLLQRDPDIKNLVENIVNHVENARKPENWPVTEYTDDFEKEHPADHKLWLQLFLMASFKSKDLADILCVLRGYGCELVKDSVYGYVIQPVLGYHLKTQAEYDEVKQPLFDYQKEVEAMLKQLRRDMPGEMKQDTLII